PATPCQPGPPNLCASSSAKRRTSRPCAMWPLARVRATSSRSGGSSVGRLWGTMVGASGVIAGLDGHGVSHDEAVGRDDALSHDGTGGHHAVMSDVRSPPDDRMGADEHVLLDHDRPAVDLRREADALPVGVGHVDGHEGGDVAAVADDDRAPLGVHLRETPDVDTLADLRLAMDPDERVERV